MFELQKLTLRRGQLTWCHDLRLEAGRCAAVMGPSGSGKTTLLEALGGFVPVQDGQIVLNGQTLTHLPAERRPVSTLFQAHNLFEHISVRHNLRLGFPKARPTEDQWRQVEAACFRLGVTELIDRAPGELSGGQRQRVALIRTVLRPQPVILLDEPFSALDESNRHTAGQWLVETLQAQGKHGLFVTHQPADATQWADQVLRLTGAKGSQRKEMG